MTDIYYIDGEFVPADRARIPVDDLAILRGCGIFDFLRTYGGKPIFLSEHLARLRRSADQIGLDLPWSSERIEQLVLETLARNTHPEANIRIVVTGGSSPDFITPAGKPRLLILVTAVMSPPGWWYREGVKIVTIHARRSFPGAKSIDYLPATVALRTAHARQAVEAVYLDEADRVLEGTTSNIFAFLDGRLVTPAEGILNGITRQQVLLLAARRYPVQPRSLELPELLGAEEVFLTSTNRGVVPVTRVDDTVIGGGSPGERTGALMAAFEAHTRRLAADYGRPPSPAVGQTPDAARKSDV